MLPYMAAATIPNVCGICFCTLRTGQGDAVFTAQCRHKFHLRCIVNNPQHGNLCCPICGANWDKDIVPPQVPPLQPNYFGGFGSRVPFQSQQPLMDPFSRNLFRQKFPKFPDDEPASYSDDEPLLATSPTQSSGPQNVTIRTHTETLAISAAESRPKFPVLVSVCAPALQDHDGRTPIDLVTVLDISGSMSGLKLDLLKRAVKFVIQNLGTSDRLSIVTFSNTARRLFPLKRMSVEGRESATLAVESLTADGGTDIAAGLKIGTRILEERKERNPVASIMLLSDGQDNYCHTPSQMLNKLPTLIRSSDMQHEIPVHTFGFGNDHDANIMHAISDASGGTFSYIESVGMIQDSFALCIGGLLSVVSQEVRLTVKSASSGVKIVAIPSGRHVSQISDEDQQGVVDVGNMYAEEEKQFLVYLSVPQSSALETKTSLLDVSCVYRDLASNLLLQVSGERIEIMRPEVCSPADEVVSLEVDRQRNRVLVAESIAEAKGLAEKGNMGGAQAILVERRDTLLKTPAAQSGDALSNLLETELREMMIKMSTKELYAHTGRAFALAGMSSHSKQRATTRGNTNTSCLSAGFGASAPFGCSPAFGAAGGQQQQQQQQSSGPTFGASAFGGSPAFGAGGSQQQQQQQQQSSGLTFGALAFGGSPAFGAGGSQQQQQSSRLTFGASASGYSFGGSPAFGAGGGLQQSSGLTFGSSFGGSPAFGAAGGQYSSGPFGASTAGGGGGSWCAPSVFGASAAGPAPSGLWCGGAPVGAYETPAMLRMVEKSKNLGLQPEKQ